MTFREILNAMWDAATTAEEKKILDTMVNFIADKAGSRHQHIAFESKDDVRTFAIEELGFPPSSE